MIRVLPRKTTKLSTILSKSPDFSGRTPISPFTRSSVCKAIVHTILSDIKAGSTPNPVCEYGFPEEETRIFREFIRKSHAKLQIFRVEDLGDFIRAMDQVSQDHQHRWLALNLGILRDLKNLLQDVCQRYADNLSSQISLRAMAETSVHLANLKEGLTLRRTLEYLETQSLDWMSYTLCVIALVDLPEKPDLLAAFQGKLHLYLDDVIRDPLDFRQWVSLYASFAKAGHENSGIQAKLVQSKEHCRPRDLEILRASGWSGLETTL